jgi:hypothetical protein
MLLFYLDFDGRNKLAGDSKGLGEKAVNRSETS